MATIQEYIDGAVEFKDTVVKGLTVDAGAAVTPVGHSVAIVGGEGVDVTASGSTITVAAELASDTNAGVAKFNAASFAVDAAGDVTIKTAGVANAQLANDSIVVGSTDVALGDTIADLAGLTSVQVDGLTLNGLSIAASGADASITLVPTGAGSVDVSGKRITSVAAPLLAPMPSTKNMLTRLPPVCLLTLKLQPPLLLSWLVFTLTAPQAQVLP